MKYADPGPEDGAPLPSFPRRDVADKLRRRIELLLLALDAARDALWCLDDVDDVDVWRKCVRNMAIMEITSILDEEILDPSNLPRRQPRTGGDVRAQQERIEELKAAFGLPSFWTQDRNFWSPLDASSTEEGGAE